LTQRRVGRGWLCVHDAVAGRPTRSTPRLTLVHSLWHGLLTVRHPLWHGLLTVPPGPTAGLLPLARDAIRPDCRASPLRHGPLTVPLPVLARSPDRAPRPHRRSPPLARHAIRPDCRSSPPSGPTPRCGTVGRPCHNGGIPVFPWVKSDGYFGLDP